MEKIREVLKAVVYALYGVDEEADVTVAPETAKADYATNLAMRLAKVVHNNPMIIAETIKAEIAKGRIDTDEGVKEVDLPGVKVEVAAPGFLNFTLDDEYFVKKVQKMAGGVELSDHRYDGQTVVAEFSDPNPFKVLHVGHLYTSIVGDSISRLMEFAGAKVVRANFGGDVGLHVGKTIWALERANITLDNLTIEDIAKCYVGGTRAYEEDEMAKQEIMELNKMIYALAELGEEKCSERLELEKIAEDFERSTAEVALIASLYWRGRELSYEYFDKFYAKIGVKFDKYYPESTVVDKGLKEVKAYIGTTYEESDGAVVYRGEKVGLHTRVFINREGVPTYETKDVGLIFTKWDDYHFDESVVVTGNEQSDYMKVVLASVSEYAPELVERTSHLTHGLVKLPGNVKMSSRKGNFLKAVDVLGMVSDSLGGKDADWKVVLAAIKYAFLKYKMGGDIVFDPQESVSTTGNSGVYLLYSAVRAKKIMQKAVGVDAKESEVVVDDNERTHERQLNKKLVQYEEVVNEAVEEKAPNKVCTYLYELAQEFSRFYENVKVVGSGREHELLVIVRAYYNVMEHGLGLLGIEVPEEM